MLDPKPIYLQHGLYSFAFKECENFIEGIDRYYDIRTEVVLEAQKAGIEVLSHYNNQTCFIKFSAKTTLEVVNSIFKLRFLALNISGAYNKQLVEDSITLLFHYSSELENRASPYHPECSGNMLSFQLKSNVNIYQVIYKLFYE
jgi:hypothetical protein